MSGRSRRAEPVERLEGEDDIYMEAGDHEHLLHMSPINFKKLMGDSPHARLGRPVVSLFV